MKGDVCGGMEAKIYQKPRTSISLVDSIRKESMVF
jgi:hypothetical protein